MTTVRFQTLVSTGSSEPKKLFEVKPGEIDLDTVHVPPHQVIIKAEAWAVNPIDWKLFINGVGASNSVVGNDVSGTVVKVGPEVKGFSVGDDVSALIIGGFISRPEGRGAFAGYAYASDYLSINYGKGGLLTASDFNGIIPVGPIKSFEGAASINAGLATAGVCFNTTMGFANLKPSEYNKKKIVLWGGGSATGFIAIQIAKHIYNLEVITVASSKHHKLLKKIGSDYTYDYSTSNVAEIIKKEHPGVKYAIGLVSSKETVQSLYDIVDDGAIVDNLSGVSESDIETDPRKKVEIKSTLAFILSDAPFNYGDQRIKATEAVLQDYDDFIYKKIPKDFIQNKLQHTELQVINEHHSFLESFRKAIETVGESKVSGQKLIIRALDVENEN